MFPVGGRQVMAVCGEGCDDVRLAEYVQRNAALQSLMNGLYKVTRFRHIHKSYS